MKKQLFICLLLGVLSNIYCQLAVSQTPELNTKIQRLLIQHNVPGVSIALIKDFKIDWSKAYGVKEIGGNESITTATYFQAASIGKPITAIAALYFVEQGLLELDENVNEYLVSWKIPENKFMIQEKVTLRQLLSHSAGVSVGGFQGYAQSEELPTLQQILNGVPVAKSQPMRVDLSPATRRRYSGGGYMIVQQLLEDIVGKPFPEIMKETVFDSIDMKSSFYAASLPEVLRDRVAVAHTVNGQPSQGKWHEFPEFGAGGGLWTTPSDLARLAIEIMLSHTGESNKVLSQKMLVEMLTPQGVDLLQGLGIGILWHRAIIHTGYNPPGYANVLVALPEKGWGAVVMTNGYNGRALRHDIVRLLAEENGILPPSVLSIIVGICLLLVLVTLILWPMTYIIRHFPFRKSTHAEHVYKKEKPLNAARITAVVETILASLIICLYVAYFINPQGPMEWSSGTIMTKVLFALVLVCSVISVVLLIFTGLVWKNGYWSILWRTHYTLFTIAMLIGTCVGYKYGHTAVVMFAIASGAG